MINQMKKIVVSFIFPILLLACSSPVRCQNGLADSLNKLISGTKQDSSRVLFLVKLSRNYLYSKPEITAQLAQKGLNLAQEIKYEKGEALCLRMMGTVIGLTGNYPKSLEILLEALKINENINDLAGIANCNISIGNNYNDQSEYGKSIFYYLKAMKIAEELHDDKLLIVALVNLGDSYEKSNNLDSAKLNTERAYELTVRLNSIEDEGVALNNLGNIYSKMGSDDLAMGYYRQSLHCSDLAQDYDNLCESTLKIARLLKKSGQVDSALVYVHLSLSVAQHSGFTKRILDASNFLSGFYEGINKVDSAFAYQKITIAAKDSLFSQEKEKALRSISFSEQTRQMEITNALLEVANKRRKNIQMAAIGVFIPVFFGIIIFFSKRKTKPKAFGFMALLALLLLFEFIALFIHPYIEEWTNNTPILMLLILVAVASILVPLHHKLEHWIKEKLLQSHIQHNHMASIAPIQ
jgi:tetratricopeptide (TPR) repeat protein